MDGRYQIRRASLADVPALVEIERGCFSDPWSATGIGESIQSETSFVFVAENAAGIVGYVMARTSGEEGEILNLAVLPAHRRRRLARRLLGEAVGVMMGARVKEVYLEVRESNAAAIQLYRAHGFRPVGLRPSYYRSPLEDALVLRAPITEVR
jgi:ribosomal-protein-alanine N-acetyltransferase